MAWKTELSGTRIVIFFIVLKYKKILSQIALQLSFLHTINCIKSR